MHAIALHVSPGHPAFPGHFPGQPLWPGVSLLSEVLEAVLSEPSLAALLGTAPRIGQAKFLAPVRPGARLVLELRASARGVHFEVHEGERRVASGHFEGAA